jgi:hypothetical protein
MSQCMTTSLLKIVGMKAWNVLCVKFIPENEERRL